ncbi:response regulator [Gaetbulibacter aestuarii]|uniref:Response regulator n=1 Tax=Gaetbulibacter aestuarii TaxID=1502358 RepID=A0ABW7MW38_9FLAO
MSITNKNRCILLVDDDNICNFITKRILEQLGYNNSIEITQNGVAALDFLENTIKNIETPLPQLILLDINMPEMNGWKFIEAFEKLPEVIVNNMKIVMLTSSISPADIKKAASTSFVAEFITKPLNLEVMQSILKKYT